MKAVISIVGIYTDKFTEADEANSVYGHLRWKDIKEMMQKGNIEFQNHTYDLHKIANGRKGIMKKKNESLETYESVISNDILKLQQEFEENTGYIPNTFTYPYGAISKESTEILKKLGFKATLSCKDGVNHITKDPECLYELKDMIEKIKIKRRKILTNKINCHRIHAIVLKQINKCKIISKNIYNKN